MDPQQPLPPEALPALVTHLYQEGEKALQQQQDAQAAIWFAQCLYTARSLADQTDWVSAALFSLGRVKALAGQMAQAAGFLEAAANTQLALPEQGEPEADVATSVGGMLNQIGYPGRALLFLERAQRTYEALGVQVKANQLAQARQQLAMQAEGEAVPHQFEILIGEQVAARLTVSERGAIEWEEGEALDQSPVLGVVIPWSARCTTAGQSTMSASEKPAAPPPSVEAAAAPAGATPPPAAAATAPAPSNPSPALPPEQAAPPASTEGGQRQVLMYLLIGGGLLICLLCACLFAIPSSGDDTGSGGAMVTPRPSATAESEEISVFDLDQGDCFNYVQEQTEEGSVDSIKVLPCTQPHENELYFTVDYPAADGEPFPGEEAIDSFAEEQCLAAFAEYVGIDFRESVFNVRYFQPTPGSWERRDDREIACFLFERDLLLEGSMQGAER